MIPPGASLNCLRSVAVCVFLAASEPAFGTCRVPIQESGRSVREGSLGRSGRWPRYTPMGYMLYCRRMATVSDPPVADAFDTPAIAALRRRSIALLSTAQIFSGLAAGSVVSVGSLMAVKLAGSDAWAGSVTTASTLGAALSSLALARLAASRGRRISLVTGLGLASLGATSIIVSACLSSRPSSCSRWRACSPRCW